LSDIVYQVTQSELKLINPRVELQYIQAVQVPCFITVQLLSGTTGSFFIGLILKALAALSSWNTNLLFWSIHQAQAIVLDVIVEVHILIVQYLVSLAPSFLAR
jgi:hypothetical protein